MKQRIKTWEIEKNNIMKLLSKQLKAEVVDIDSHKMAFKVRGENYFIYSWKDTAPLPSSCNSVNSREEAASAFDRKLEDTLELERIFKISKELLW
jgi:hypothetical protein